MRSRNQEFYNLNEARSYPFTEYISGLPFNLLVDAVLYTASDTTVYLTSVTFDSELNTILTLSNGYTCTVPQVYTVYSPIAVKSRNADTGIFVFGSGVKTIQRINLSLNCKFEPSTVLCVPGIVKSINWLAGIISFFEGNGIQITKSANNLIFSAIYEKEPCD